MAAVADLLQSGLQPPPRASDAYASGRYALLPQQSEGELHLSEVHANLDGALAYLRSVIGYPLLDDARPHAGGGVRLGRGEAWAAAARGGGPRAQRVPPHGPVLDEEEVRQVIMYSRETARYAQYSDDLVLVWRFVSLIRSDSPGPQQDKESLYKIVLQGVRLMHLCDYHYSDVVLTLAYASVYFQIITRTMGDRLGEAEKAHVVVLLIFLAHSFVLDEGCPLRCWQKHIFRKYCTLKVLDAALFKLFEMQDFRLKVTEDEEKEALGSLLDQKHDIDVVLKLRDSRCILHQRSPNGDSQASQTSTAASSAVDNFG